MTPAASGIWGAGAVVSVILIRRFFIFHMVLLTNQDELQLQRQQPQVDGPRRSDLIGWAPLKRSLVIRAETLRTESGGGGRKTLQFLSFHSRLLQLNTNEPRALNRKLNKKKSGSFINSLVSLCIISITWKLILGPDSGLCSTLMPLMHKAEFIYVLRCHRELRGRRRRRRERKKKTLRELAVLLDCKSAAETTNRKWQDEKQVQVCGNNPVGIFTTLFLMDLTEW